MDPNVNEVKVEEPKWAYTQPEKKATNYEKLRGRGYTKTPFTTKWKKRRNRKNKLVRLARRRNRR